MRRAALALVVLALLLGASRLFTGIVYAGDEPTAYLVLKHAPDIRIERPEADGLPIGREVILDTEEPSLVYGWLYIETMRAVPVLDGLMLVAAAVLLLLLAAWHPQRR